MFQRQIKRAKLALFIAVPLLITGAAIAASQSTVYTYDVLGRVTYVTDTKNGNRDYDYDPAGNRLNVAAGTTGDSSSEPVPPPVPDAPTGLSYQQSSQCSWRASWTASAKASSYMVHDWAGYHYVPVIGTTAEYSACGDPGFNGYNLNDYRPKWVQACNVKNVCGNKAYF